MRVVFDALEEQWRSSGALHAPASVISGFGMNETWMGIPWQVVFMCQAQALPPEVMPADA